MNVNQMRDVAFVVCFFANSTNWFEIECATKHLYFYMNTVMAEITETKIKRNEWK